MAAVNAFSRFYQDQPPITKVYITASVLTTLAVHIDLLSPFQLYFNPKLIFGHHQYWRLITTFLFFGPLGFSFLFNTLFTYRYCRMLEEQCYRNRTADFFYMFLIGATLMGIIAYFVNLIFLGQAFTMMLVYIWGRRNPRVRMNFFGIVNFDAPYLSWVLLIMSLLLGSSVVVEVAGIAVGHFYFFFEDIFPSLPHGFRLLKTPHFLKVLFNRLNLDEPQVDEDERRERFEFPPDFEPEADNVDRADASSDDSDNDNERN